MSDGLREPLVLPTEREGVIIRELWSDEDDKAYNESYNASRPEIVIFDPDSVAKHRTVEQTRQARLNAGKNIRMGIWDGHTFVGSVNGRPDEKGVEVGYWTDSRYAGHGYATLATSALAGYLADTYPVVHAAVLEGNHASIRVQRKAGFRKVGAEAGQLLFEYNPVTIGQAEQQDAEPLTDFMQPIYASTYPNDRGITRTMFENDTFRTHLRDYLKEKLADPNVTLLVACDRKGTITGTIGIESRPNAEHTAEIWGFYVDPALQSQGIGTELWESLMASELCKVVSTLTLTVAKDSVVATEFYKKHGFQIVGEQEWDWPSWTTEHLVNQYWLMQKSTAG